MRRILFPLILTCAVLLGVSQATAPADLRLLDLQFDVLREQGPRPVNVDVVIVGIDADTVSALPEPLSLWHRHLARFLEAMVFAQPSAVGLDIVLPERSYDVVAPGYDGALLRGLLTARRSYPVVLAQTVDPSGATRAIHRPFLVAAGEGATGYALLATDGDGVVRRFDERLGETGERVATLAGQLARRLGVVPGSGLIDYGSGKAFDYVPLLQVLDWASAGDQAALERVFRGRPVLLGVVLPYEDRQRLPVQLASWEDVDAGVPGVLLHAQVLRGLLNDGGLIRQVPVAVVIAMSAAAALLWFLGSGAVVFVAAGVLLVAGLLLLSTLLLVQGLYLPVLAPVSAGLLALSGRAGWEAALKLRERRRLRGVFSGYVSPGVMQQIVDGRLRAELGGEHRYVCVLFSDIRGYTTRSEGMSPEEIVGFLNRYFEDVVGLIHGHGGTVTSFMGDGIMAVFGAPNALENPCEAAFSAGRDILAQVARFNAQADPGAQPVEIGVGLHAGYAVVGHVGSSTRHDYTAIGDVTNVASRLEGATKGAGYRLVCSDEVASRLGNRSMLVPLGPVSIKGHSPVEAHGCDRV
jgi:adenylate cyclase